MAGRNIRRTVLAAALLVAPPAWADLPLDKYQEAVKDSATSPEAQAFLNGYFIGLAAGRHCDARHVEALRARGVTEIAADFEELAALLALDALA